jgi:hypothetical protein
MKQTDTTSGLCARFIYLVQVIHNKNHTCLSELETVEETKLPRLLACKTGEPCLTTAGASLLRKRTSDFLGCIGHKVTLQP